jgi:hypothetical protein
MIKLKKLLKEDDYLKDAMNKDTIDEKMSDEKKSFLMLKIYGQSWGVNFGNILKGINRGKPTLIKKGLKEIKILNKKIEEMIEELI